MYVEVKAKCIVIGGERMVKEREYVTHQICSG
jgi:hypothetical protein